MSRALPLVLAATISAALAGAALLPDAHPASTAAPSSLTAENVTAITPVSPLDWTVAGRFAAHGYLVKKAADARAAQVAAAAAADARARQARLLEAQRRASRARVAAVSYGSPRDIARAQLAGRGWGDQFGCLDSLWQRESGWRVTASNASGAYGIPQSLPGSKMSSAGADWRTNPATQIRWGLGYIASSYGSPCAAWSHSQSYNWY